MNQFVSVTEDILQKLVRIVGRRHVITSSSAEMEDYSHDEAPTALRHFPEVVVKPDTTEAISEVLRLANTAHIAVTPRGGGTGLSGGAVPLYGGIVLSLERLNRIQEIDEDNFVAVTQAGVLLQDLRREVERRGLYYPVYPGEGTAHIGGNVATNAGGMRAVTYGVTRNFVLGIEAVLASGQIIRSGGKFVKCSTAYDLAPLLIGSEGTLAVITEITLRLIAKLPAWHLLYIPFTSLHKAIEAVPRILKLNVPLVGLEFLEQDVVRIIEAYLERAIPYHENPAFLMAILEGRGEEDLNDAARSIAEVCIASGAEDVYIPMGARAKRDLFEVREKVYPALKSARPIEVLDVVVPRSRIADFVGEVKQLSAHYGIPVIASGHAGDGNVHLHVMGKGIDTIKWQTHLPDLLKDIYRAGVAMGGMISGEHGLGSEKKSYLPLAIPEEQIDLMKRMRQAFDPNGILNPRKVFPD